MSSLFDVDCPRTPDGDSQPDHTTPRHQYQQHRKKMPPMAPSRPPRMSRKSSRGRARSSSSSTRSRSTPRRVGGGLEPEEYIVPGTMRKEPAASYSGSGGNGVMMERPRAYSSEMAHGYANGGGGVPRAPSSGPSRFVPTAPSSGAYTVSPRVEGKSYGGGDMQHGHHPRSNSGDWWKEEIVDETEDKDIAMDKHYGSSLQQQQRYQGKPSTNPFDASTNQYYGNPSTTTRGYNNSHQNEVVDTEQGLHPHARGGNDRVLSPIENLNNNNNNGNSLNTSLYDQANQMRHSGYYHSDEYSLNHQANHHHPHLSDIPISPREIGSPPQYREKRAHVRNNFLPRWLTGFKSGKSHNNNNNSMPPYEMNIAPKGSSTASTSSEWFSSSQKGGVFDTSFNPNGVRKRGIAAHWDRLSPAKKVSIGVILVALVCTIMGVSVSETKKNHAAREKAALALAMANQPTPSPTSGPTDVPSLAPTDPPTRVPTTRSPVAGYASVHGKDSDGTRRPSRSPITMSPTRSPIGTPSSSPTIATSVSNAPTVPTAPLPCVDVAGEFMNHLANPKTCAWLNKEPGFSDRKNKNCGTQWPDGTIFPVTDLGQHCQSTCALYNNCGLMNARTNEFEYERPMAASGGEMMCENQVGLFKNHLDVEKDCAWLYNGKPGQTDRKSKNCGWGPNAMTELGFNCPQTCVDYNGGSGCWDLSQGDSVGDMSTRTSVVIESTIEVEEEEHSSTECIDGSGRYMNHKGEKQSCEWLHTDFRLERNCGFDRHEITKLGERCPWSCREYNSCSFPGEHL